MCCKNFPTTTNQAIYEDEYNNSESQDEYSDSESQEEQEDYDEVLNNPLNQQILRITGTNEFNQAFRYRDTDTLFSKLCALDSFCRVYNFIKAKKDENQQQTNNEISLLVNEEFFSEESDFEYKNHFCFTLKAVLDMIFCDGKAGGYDVKAYEFPNENNIISFEDGNLLAKDVCIFTFNLVDA